MPNGYTDGRRLVQPLLFTISPVPEQQVPLIITVNRMEENG